MTVTELDTYRNQTTGQALLGRVLLVSVLEADTRADIIADKMHAAGLGKHAPKAACAADTWRKRTTAAKRTKVPVPGFEDRTVSFIVRDVDQDTEQIVRRLVVEVRDSSKRRLVYLPDAVTLTFVRDGERFQSNIDRYADGMTPELYDVIAQHVRATAQDYAQKLGTVDSTAIRTMINNALGAVNAVTVRKTGGAWFVPEKNADTVERLEQACETIPNVYIHSLPLLDTSKQRGHLTESIADHVRAKTAEITDKLNKELAKDAPSKRTVATLGRLLQQLKDQAGEYQGILERNLDDSVTSLALVDQQMLAVLSRTAA